MTELNFWGNTFFPSESVEICESPCSCYYFYQMVEDVPKFNSRGEAVLQEYQETENPCRCHRKTND